MGYIILMKIIMATNTLPLIITIPITLIRMATITILILKDMGGSQDTREEDTRVGDTEVGEGILEATVVTAMGLVNSGLFRFKVFSAIFCNFIVVSVATCRLEPLKRPCRHNHIWLPIRNALISKRPPTPASCDL
jgi:hypothetical protein